ncbi:hypothetical protein cand_019970 [Cryptosporidium andersoni]|uniref:Uncharacterized protein n=1 Tax=Cryptosporidium andersoni TaxID=117008 RepID=A0A1J4MT89_9CRYT|nr:hypothetical protein cand_019970 [Cryptosporidium andersoni]
MYSVHSGPVSSRGVSEYSTPTVMSHGNPVISTPQHFVQRVNPLMCCAPQSTNMIPQKPPSRMISAAALNVSPVNPPSRFATGSSISPAAIMSAPERQVTEPLQHRQTFVYGGAETMEPEDCGWLEPIRLKVHAMEVQQYIDPGKPEVTPPFIYNIDHLKECVEVPENWAPESITGVAALTFENLNTNPPSINYPLRLTSENSQVGTSNPYIQPIQYHIERIKDIQQSEPSLSEKPGVVEELEESSPNNRFSATNFISSILDKFRTHTAPIPIPEEEEVTNNDDSEESKEDYVDDTTRGINKQETGDNNIRIEEALPLD